MTDKPTAQPPTRAHLCPECGYVQEERFQCGRHSLHFSDIGRFHRIPTVELIERGSERAQALREVAAMMTAEVAEMDAMEAGHGLKVHQGDRWRHALTTWAARLEEMAKEKE